MFAPSIRSVRARLARNAATLLVLPLICAACRKPSESTSETAPPAPGTAELAKETFGEPLTGLAQVPLQTLIQTPEQFDGKVVGVEGKVRRACSAKGCWMELASDATGPGCRVTFKDYGFFVPTDSAGATARLEGTVSTRKVSKQRVEHWESEGAQFPNKNADGSANEVRLVATGVELVR